MMTLFALMSILHVFGCLCNINKASREEYEAATLSEQRSHRRKENASLWICVQHQRGQVWDRGGKCSGQMFCRTFDNDQFKVLKCVWVCYNWWNQHWRVTWCRHPHSLAVNSPLDSCLLYSHMWLPQTEDLAAGRVKTAVDICVPTYRSSW